MKPRSARVRRLLVFAVAALVALAVSACGGSRGQHPTVGGAENIYVNSGPLTYQVQLTRELNPFATEDVQYLAGIPKAQSIPANQLWFAVFLWAKNQSNRSHVSATHFQIVDSQGKVYQPWPLNSSVNDYAWTPQLLAPDGVEPNPDSTSHYGPTQGGLILFRLNDSVFSNRPLTLRILGPGAAHPSTVSLDV